jgi:hypothetical protein
MKRSFRMTIQQATEDYERWLSGPLEIVPEDLLLKHQRMSDAAFPFLRATYYRWAQLFPHLCKELGRAPQVLAVGDLHVENFGTWRDAEGRLVWGINDFDEVWKLPYVHDLVRLATSAHLAIDDGHLAVSAKEACESLLGGYREGLEASGRPFVLAEHSESLREMATARLADPHRFWDKLERLPSWQGELPARAAKALASLLPRSDLPRRVVHRVAGRGSLGRQRFVALADWQGGKIAREAKALAPSAALWAHGGDGSPKVLYQAALDQSVRSVDPWVKVRRRWVVRRLAPDCSRIELADLPGEREETRLLRAMGWETANVHLGSRSAHAMLVDLAAREPDWLHQAAKVMLAAVHEDWEAWRKQPSEPAVKAAKPTGASQPAGAGEPGGAAAGAGGTLVMLPGGRPGGEASAEEAGGAGEEENASAAGDTTAGGRGGTGRVRKESKATIESKASRQGKAGKSKGKGEKDAKGDKGRKGGKGEKAAKGERAGKGEKGVKGEKAGKGEKGARGAKAGKRVAAAAATPKAGKGDKARKGPKAGKKAAKPKRRAARPASRARVRTRQVKQDQASATQQEQAGAEPVAAGSQDAGGEADQSAGLAKRNS